MARAGDVSGESDAGKPGNAGTGAGIDDDFDGASLDAHWTAVLVGGGVNEVAGSVLRMSLPFARAGAYSDAQVDDYENSMRATFQWRPPLRI